MTTNDYLATDETVRRRELLGGRLREPAAPRWGHQAVVTGLTAELGAYVRREGLGKVCVSPIDVVLDRDKNLVVQPDIVFVSTTRLAIIRGQIWGAPDLTIEVFSKGSLLYDSKTKLEWYREYGVLEYWLVNPLRNEIGVVRFGNSRMTRRFFKRGDTVRSRALPGLRLRVDDALSW